MRFNLLQHAVSEDPALGVVESLDESVQYSQTSSSTTMHTYDKYRSLLRNACIKYDQKILHSSSKSSGTYQFSQIDEQDIFFDQGDTFKVTHEGGINLPSDQFMDVNTATHPSRPPPCSCPGPPQSPSSSSSPPTQASSTIFLPPDIYKLLTQDVKDAIMAHNTAVCRTSPHSPHAHVYFPDETYDDVFDDPDLHLGSTPPTDEDHPELENELLSTLKDDIINNMMHAYQTKLSRSTNPSCPFEIKMAAHYHVAHAQASHFGSLVNCGTNGGLA